MNSLSTEISTVVHSQNQALIIQGNTIQYVQNCMDCPFSKKVHDPDPLDWFADMEESLICSQHTKQEVGQKPYIGEGMRNSDTIPEARIVFGESWNFRMREEAIVPGWCKFLRK